MLQAQSLSKLPGIRHGFFTRAGGVSEGVYESLNGGVGSEDSPAKVAENRALVVLAEAEVPRAIADAFRNGNLGVMDYYKLRNVQADTAMREAVARPGDGAKA